MKVSIFICSYRKHFPYLIYCLRSIERFARGFNGVTILVPDEDIEELRQITGSLSGESGMLFHCVSGEEWPGKGFLWHMAQILRADEWCPEADYIAHFDSDCIFTEPVKPSRFFCQGKPILRYEAYATIGERHPGVLRWREAAEACLPFKVPHETMRCHPEVYWKGTYRKVRDLMSATTGQSYLDYIRNCRNEFPQTFAEHPTIGAVAMRYHQDEYHLHDCATQPNPDRQDTPVIQFWSHAPLDQPQKIWIFGEQETVVPSEVIARYGLL